MNDSDDIHVISNLISLIVKAKSDKFKQINRFLEILNDVIGEETYLKIKNLELCI